MFCHKCGTEIAEGAEFCYKCGTKVVAEPAPQPIHQSADKDADFKAFVDNHVKATTRYQSAEDLLKRSKPQLFMIPCFVVPAILGFYAGGPLGALLLGILFGQGARYIVGFLIRRRCTSKTSGRFHGNIDAESLCFFLNKRLGYLEPYFHSWDMLSGRGYVLTLGASPDEKNIGSAFGTNKRSTAIICIRPDLANPNSGEMQYIFGAVQTDSLISEVASWTILAAVQINEARHSCLMKSAPILHAAVEYYLQHQGGNENVLH